MTRSSRKEELLRVFRARAHIAQTLGMELSFDGEDRPVLTMAYDPRFDEASGGIHGGICATLLDTAAWYAAAMNHAGSSWIATSELSLRLLKPPARTDLRAVGALVKGEAAKDTAEAHLYDASGELVAHAVGTFIVLPHLSVGPRAD